MVSKLQGWILSILQKIHRSEQPNPIEEIEYLEERKRRKIAKPEAWQPPPNFAPRPRPPQIPARPKPAVLDLPIGEWRSRWLKTKLNPIHETTTQDLPHVRTTGDTPVRVPTPRLPDEEVMEVEDASWLNSTPLELDVVELDTTEPYLPTMKLWQSTRQR